MTRCRRALLTCAFVLSATLASVFGVGGGALAQPFSELRGGVYAHDVPFLQNSNETRSPDINLDLLFKSPDFLTYILSPRPHIGATVNTDGGTSLFYAGFDWTFALMDNILTSDDGLFVGGSLDMAVHDGRIGRNDVKNPDGTYKDNSYGCRWAFHESFTVGYSFGPNAVMLTGEHLSNANLCDENNGITNFGVRYGYRF